MLHVKDINPKVAHGERVVISGPSRAGKSTPPCCPDTLEEDQESCILFDCVELTNDPPLPASPAFGATLFSFLLEA